jgi:hypothetical protein
MKEMTCKVVQSASQDEVFQALTYAALKARAGRIAPNQIIMTCKQDLIVAEDENGEGLVVQMILPGQKMEALALTKASDLDCSVQCWNAHEKQVWLEEFWIELARYLATWQGIRIRRGPGENITFEKTVSR